MQHITSLGEANLPGSSVVTIGSFDGVHRGHQYLIKHLVKHAREYGQTPVVLTFFPHPRMVLGGFQPGFYLTLPDDKARLLGELGVEVVVTHPFNDDVRQVRAAHFVEGLIEHLKMAALWVGEDFTLGYQREGNVEFLRKMGQERGFEVRTVDLMDSGDERVSSSRIREALSRGEVAEAARLLGRPHFVRGEIVEGSKRGRSIGIPTANLKVPLEMAVPKHGVYAGWMHVAGERHMAMINIGLRPTFEVDVPPTVEAHLLDFSGDIYGEEATLSFEVYLRDEQKFDGVDALVTQIRADIERGRALLGG